MEVNLTNSSLLKPTFFFLKQTLIYTFSQSVQPILCGTYHLFLVLLKQCQSFIRLQSSIYGTGVRSKTKRH